MMLLALMAAAAYMFGSEAFPDAASPEIIDPWAGPATGPTASQNAAARQLATFLQASASQAVRDGKQFSEQVKSLQAAMGGLKADGFAGPLTRQRAQELGVTLP